MKLHSKAFKRVLALSLSLIIALPVQALQKPLPALPKQNAEIPTQFSNDPVFEKFKQSSWKTPAYGPFDAQDPILDNSPYFMADQNWSTTQAHSADLTQSRSTSNGLQIQIKQSKRALTIHAPLRPLFETSEFLIFKASSEELFKAKAGGESDAADQGLFFIDKSLLTYESTLRHRAPAPVPIFFLPLFGRGWAGTVNATLDSDFEVLALRTNNGSSQTLDLQSLRDLSKVYQTNILSIRMSQLRNEPSVLKAEFERARQSKTNVEVPPVSLPRGSTAVFGMYATGLDLDRPNRSESELISKWKSLDKLKNLLLPQAVASDLLSPDVIERLLIVSKITSAVAVTSIVAQYTVLKERMKERRAFIESRQDQARAEKGLAPIDRSSVAFKAKRGFKESIDVFTHGLATLASGISTASGYIIEYGADKFFGKEGSSPHGLIRKFLEYTFIYSRKQNEFIASNFQTFVLGVLILGGIDTAFVVLQLLFVSPFFFPWAAQVFGDNMRERVQKDFSGGNENMNNIITSEIMRNLSAYFVSGAYSYSSSQRQKILEDLRPEI
ncbi:MAG: hypothetical protein AABZ31_07065, partial [Bdellovibrionota bacterium]